VDREIISKRLSQIVRPPLFWVSTFFAILVIVYFWRVFFWDEVVSTRDILKHNYPWKALTPSDFRARNPWISDALDQYLPSQFLAHEAFQDSRLPLWNPYTASGTPITLINYGLFYPLNAHLSHGNERLGLGCLGKPPAVERASAR
jgi:hypothetical protein